MKLMLNNNVMLRDSQPQITNFIRTRRLLAAIWPRCALIVRKKSKNRYFPGEDLTADSFALEVRV
jgi:hypothetical protein